MSNASKLKVFISYSRADTAFADELVAGIEFKDEFEVSIDRQSIVEGEDWAKRLGALIAYSDTIVFLLSPDSAQSQICAWEVEEAHRLSKRILPVLIRPIGSTPAPSMLAALNYVRFDEGRSFMVGLIALVRALKMDVDWLREHTRLLTRAIEWDDAQRPANRLLSGTDIVAAKGWLARQPKDAPSATSLHLDFIRASEEAEDQRLDAERRQLTEMTEAQSQKAAALQEREAAMHRLRIWTRRGLTGAAMGTLGGAGLGYWGYDAERRVRVEQENAKNAAAIAREAAIKKEALRTDLAGQLVAYAAAPGQFASDGPLDSNSPFTAAMIQSLSDQSMSLLTAIATCNKRVLEISAGRQRPYLTSDLNGDVYLFHQPAQRRRVALTVSVDGFRGRGMELNLPNVHRDSEAWANLLRKAGFDTTSLSNPSLSALRQAIEILSLRVAPERRGSLDDRFVHRVGIRQLDVPVSTLTTTEDAIAVVFYSGIGITTNGLDYLTAKDSLVDGSSGDSQQMLPLRKTLDLMRERFPVSIVILDTNFNSLRPQSR